MLGNGQKTRVKAQLLVADTHGSIIGIGPLVTPNPLVYTAYGYRPGGLDLRVMLGFNGQIKDSVSGCYPLGNGYRDYDPYLMRFRSPDNLSPFGEGGINAYVYCAGDPVNNIDPSGHMRKTFKKFFGINDRNYYEEAVKATQAIPELAAHGNWYDSPHVTNKHLKKAAKLGQAKSVLENFEPDPSLTPIISTEDQRGLAQAKFDKMQKKTLGIIANVKIEAAPPVNIEPLPTLQELRPQSSQEKIRQKRESNVQIQSPQWC